MDRQLQESKAINEGNISIERDIDQDPLRARPGRKAKEKVPGIDCAADVLGVVRHLIPHFNDYLAEIPDPREEWRVVYNTVVQMWSMILQRLGVADSNRIWDDVRHLGDLCGSVNAIAECDLKNLAHSDTMKYLAKRLDPEDLNEVLCKSFVALRKAKRLAPFKFDKDTMIAIDATVFNTSKFPMAHSCHRKLNNGKIEYFQAALVVTIVSSSGIRIPLMVEFIKNNEGADEYDKQDCEYKAFLRLIKKLKRRFPHQKFCLLLDGLYFKSEAINLFERNNWRYIITWKFDSVKKFYQVAMDKMEEEKDNTLSVEDKGGLERYTCNWTNGIKYKPVGAKQGYKVNALRAKGVFEWGKGNKSEFAFITNKKIKKENVQKILNKGRSRWQIETNFNVQKNSELTLESTFGACKNAALVYFMIVQLASMLRTLMTSTNYFEKLVLMENTGSTLGTSGTTFAEFYRTAKAFMIHFRDALFYKCIDLNKISKGVHIFFNTS